MTGENEFEKEFNERRHNVMEIKSSQIKTVVIASVLSAVIVFVFSTLWFHQIDITELKTNQKRALADIAMLATLPEIVSAMNINITALVNSQQANRLLLEQNAELLRTNAAMMRQRAKAE